MSKADQFIAQQKALNNQRRDALLLELAGLERTMGYGTRGKPLTNQLRKWFQQTGGFCHNCGKGQLARDDT